MGHIGIRLHGGSGFVAVYLGGLGFSALGLAGDCVRFHSPTSQQGKVAEKHLR